MADEHDSPTRHFPSPDPRFAPLDQAEATTLGRRGLGDAPQPQVLGRYFVLRELGSGGMGVVYEAYDPELDRRIALKVLRPDWEGRQSEASEGRTRLQREAQALGRLSHPNVVHVYDVGSFGPQVFVAMELVAGQTLSAWMRQPRHWRRIVALFLQAGRGLEAVHAAGLVHRDFKPGNVIVGDDGRVRVMDFGIARAVDERLTAPHPAAAPRTEGDPEPELPLTRVGTIMGTPLYMAPELIHGGAADARSDQFAFCVALYEALYGVQPFDADGLLERAAAALRGEIQEAPKSAGVPGWVREVVLRGLSGRPEERYPTLQALLDDLANDRSLARRRRLLAAAASVAVLGLGGFLYLAGQKSERRCAGAGQLLARSWGPSARDPLERAFLATGRPFAASAYAGVERGLDEYGSAWAAMRTEACEATRRGEQSAELLDLRMQCLDQRRRELGRLVELLTAAEPSVVERAVQAVGDLAPLGECADPAGLLAPLRQPEDAATRARAEEIKAQLAEARANWTTGHFEAARTRAGEAVGAARRLAYAPLEAEALWQRALVEDSAGDYKAAERSHHEVLEAALRGRHELLMARAWLGLMWVTGFRLQRFDEGERFGRLALASQSRLPQNEELLADIESGLALVQDAQGGHERGLALQRQALARYERLHGPEHQSVDRCLNRLGTTLYNLGRSAEALEVYQRALQLSERSLGHDHPTVAVRLGNMALAYEGLGQIDEALRAQREALAIEERTIGSRHPSVEFSLINLAGLLTSADRLDEALVIGRRALQLQGELDAASADMGVACSNLGDTLLALGRPQEALELHQRGLLMMERTVGPEHEWTADALAGLGRSQLALGRAAEALSPLQRALRVAGGPQQAKPQLLFGLARALWDTGGDRRRALEHARLAESKLQGGLPLEKRQRQEVRAWLLRHG